MYKIGVIGGDGTGPEVVAEALKVLKSVEKKFNVSFSFTPLDFVGDRYLKSG